METQQTILNCSHAVESSFDSTLQLCGQESRLLVPVIQEF